jgi:hypothetical protein
MTRYTDKELHKMAVESVAAYRKNTGRRMRYEGYELCVRTDTTSLHVIAFSEAVGRFTATTIAI